VKHRASTCWTKALLFRPVVCAWGEWHQSCIDIRVQVYLDT
jgi:hypothetical protein